MEQAKYFLYSKTFWVNLATGVSVLGAILGAVGIMPNAEIVDKVATIMTALNPFINIYLRGKTTAGLTYTKPV